MESQKEIYIHSHMPIFKCADDASLVVPENTDVPFSDDFSHIQTWAVTNSLLINPDKTNELVLHRPHPSKLNLPQSLESFEHVQTVKLLGVIFQSSFSYVKLLTSWTQF